MGVIVTDTFKSEMTIYCHIIYLSPFLGEQGARESKICIESGDDVVVVICTLMSLERCIMMSRHDSSGMGDRRRVVGWPWPLADLMAQNFCLAFKMKRNKGKEEALKG